MLKNYTDDFFELTNIVVFNSFGFFFLDFLIPFVAVELLKMNGIEMGFLFSLRTIGYFFGSSFIGILTDKYSKKNLVIFGSTGRGIAYFIMYLAIISINLTWLMFSNLLLGLMAGFFWIPFDALVADKSMTQNRSEAYGKRTAAQGRGTFIGAILGFFLLINFEPNILLMYIGIPLFGIANFYASWKAYIKITDERLENDKVPKIMYENSTFKESSVPKLMLFGIIVLLFVIFLEAIIGSLAKPYIIPYLLGNFISNVSIASFIYIPVGLVSILLASKLGNLIDKVNIYLGISIGSALGALITYLLINTSSIIIFSVLLTLMEVIDITIELILSNIFSRISVKHRGKLIGLNAFFTNFGAIIGPLAGGILWQFYSDKTPFIFSIEIGLLIIPFFILSLILISPYIEEKIQRKQVLEV